MATESRFTIAEAQVINGSRPPQGLGSKEMFDRFLGSLERDKHAAYSTLIFSYLHHDKEKELWIKRRDADTISANPSLEEMRNQVRPQLLCIPDFFIYFLHRLHGIEPWPSLYGRRHPYVTIRKCNCFSRGRISTHSLDRPVPLLPNTFSATHP